MNKKGKTITLVFILAVLVYMYCTFMSVRIASAAVVGGNAYDNQLAFEIRMKQKQERMQRSKHEDRIRKSNADLMRERVTNKTHSK